MTDLGPLWESDEPGKHMPINACVVHDKKTDKYFVFMTTDTDRTARQIINTYELRPEIEEDFRQMKDFGKLEDFKSTKYNYNLSYHNDTGRISLFPGIQKSGRRESLCRKITSSSSKELQRNTPQIGHHLCWAVFWNFSFPRISTVLCRMHFRSPTAS